MMDAKILTASEVEKIENSAIRRMYKEVPFVYAHGQLAEDMGTDVVYLLKGDNNLCNGLRAYWHGEPVRFHLYRHPKFGHLTGVVTYSMKDSVAYNFGRRLVEIKPATFELWN